MIENASGLTPIQIGASFASELLGRLLTYDIAAVESLIDINSSDVPVATNFPPPEGFTYAASHAIAEWSMHILNANEDGFACHFHLPFAESDFRPAYARFYFRCVDAAYEVEFEGVVPS